MRAINLSEYHGIYFDECDDCLQDLEAALNDPDLGRKNLAPINTAFRAVHSIKGGAAALGLNRITQFAHEFEEVLDGLRNGSVNFDKTVLANLHLSSDRLAVLIEQERAGKGSEGCAPEAASDTDEVQYIHRIDFRPHLDFVGSGHEPLALLAELRRMGELDVLCDTSTLPAMADLDCGKIHLAWNIVLRSEHNAAEVREVFEFVEDRCELSITSETETPAERHELPEATDSLAVQATRTTVRVDLDRVERLGDMIGEFVVAQSILMGHVDYMLKESHPEFVESLLQFVRHTQAMQDAVMAIRAQPVGTLFARIPRMVRDLSARLGKRVNIILEGEETEIDRTIIEQLPEPLTHMIRNAVDHGIETPEERVRLGKPAHGRVVLSASQRGGQIIITVTDDGRGLDRQRILQNARKRGLVSSDAQPDEAEIDALIFAPGLSTADTVSEISGRGVGMDVVAQNIRRLGGNVAVRSRTGAGMVFRMTLPLTLAIFDGMLVRIGTTTFVIPLTSIIQSIVFDSAAVSRIGPDTTAIAYRGRYLALIDLAERFGSHIPQKKNRLIVILDCDGGEPVALAVDSIIGQQQVVVKSLEKNLGRLPGLSGATILADGEVALIVDVSAIGMLAGDKRGTSLTIVKRS